MNRDAFEQLVSAWLDEPHRFDLRRRVEEAVLNNPELARVLHAWQRCERLLGEQRYHLPGVDWDLVSGRITAAVDRAAAEDEVLDGLLRRLPPVDDRVDWPRFRARVVAAATGGRGVVARRPRSGVITGVAALLAAAAALLITFMPDAGPRVPVSGPATVHVTVSGPPAGEAEVSEGVVIVRVTSTRAMELEPERYFVVDPIVTSEPSDETVGFY